jgi:hypothetical protein
MLRPRESDIDFVAVTAARPDAAALDALGRAHARLQARYPRPYFDGVYVTWADLRRDPTTQPLRRRGAASTHCRFA